MEDALAIRDEYRLQEWRQIIQAGQNSGLSKREFCRQNGISERQYYYWLKKLRETVAETASPRLVHLEAPVPQSEGSDTPPSFACVESPARRVKKTATSPNCKQSSAAQRGRDACGTATRISASLFRRLSVSFGSTPDQDTQKRQSLPF